MKRHSSEITVALLVCLLLASGDAAAKGAAVAGRVGAVGPFVGPLRGAPIGVVKPVFAGPRLPWRGHRSHAPSGVPSAVVEGDGYPIGAAPLGYAPSPYPGPVLDPDDEFAPRLAPFRPMCGWQVYRVPAEQGGGMKSITVTRC
jgi:hypothetical protein